jgi:hypothetical protein
MIGFAIDYTGRLHDRPPKQLGVRDTLFGAAPGPVVAQASQDIRIQIS